MNAQKMAANIVGVVLIVGGIAAGLYAGLWWAFIGGIVQIIEAVKANPVEAMDIATGIVRVIFAGAIGCITSFCLVLPGVGMLRA